MGFIVQTTHAIVIQRIIIENPPFGHLNTSLEQTYLSPPVPDRWGGCRALRGGGGTTLFSVENTSTTTTVKLHVLKAMNDTWTGRLQDDQTRFIIIVGENSSPVAGNSICFFSLCAIKSTMSCRKEKNAFLPSCQMHGTCTRGCGNTCVEMTQRCEGSHKAFALKIQCLNKDRNIKTTEVLTGKRLIATLFLILNIT